MKAGIFAKNTVKSLKPKTVEFLDNFDTLFAVREFGGDVFERATILECPMTGLQYKDQIRKAVSVMMEAGVDLMVSIGGDGLASYVASALICDYPVHPMVLGIPAGTANVGPIVCPIGNTYQPVELDGIEVCDGDEVLGYAFNDLIIGDTFLGKVDGKTVNLSARALAIDDQFVVQAPSDDIVSPDFSISLNGRKLEYTNWENTRQICVSAMREERLEGRAIFGGLLEGAYTEHPAAIGLYDHIIVDSRQENWNRKKFFQSTVLCFDESDVIELGGLTDKGQLIIDGNPFIRKNDTVRIRCVKAAITALRSIHE